MSSEPSGPESLFFGPILCSHAYVANNVYIVAYITIIFLTAVMRTARAKGLQKRRD